MHSLPGSQLDKSHREFQRINTSQYANVYGLVQLTESIGKVYSRYGTNLLVKFFIYLGIGIAIWHNCFPMYLL